MTNDPSKPRRAKPRLALSRERIAEAAFQIVHAEGLAALSARRLATTLQCEAMSIYHHAPNMDAVLDDIVDRLLSLLALPTHESRNPRRDLLTLSRGFLDLADRHPHVFVVAVSRRWTTPTAYALAQASVSLFQSAGAPQRAALRNARILGAYLGGAGSALAGWRLSHGDPGTEKHRALDAAAPKLRRQSTLGNVRRDLDLGLGVVIDALLQREKRQ
ncbi:TetR/AcrR family transcriptional regulator [Tahibacter amnicola]|uniref:TetR/AcrR family transcriptional regulator n=1 Tax=Tahibacter amnicola TaxID=2976241 RepID=A0ABY6BLJ0_9GAMM|nr:TetR/AcrR family transcriptional regulator [Tahibacter amnicola]UXI70303.1 TetR/AcrR family transcriptional regulator [Tahibacter amnicola]